MTNEEFQNNRLDNFVFLPRYLKDMVFDKEITTQEFQVLSWIRLLADPYGIATTSFDDLVNDLDLPSKNRANAIILGLKKKGLLDYQDRAGKKGSFKIYLDFWSLPNNGGIRQRGDFYRGIPKKNPQHSPKDSNSTQRSTYQKQSFEEIYNVTPQDLNTFLMNIENRGTNTHTHKDKDILSVNKLTEEAITSNGTKKENYFDVNTKRIVETSRKVDKTEKVPLNTEVTELDSYKKIKEFFKDKPFNPQKP